jgi:peptide alpha-N-acetyltransferase
MTFYDGASAAARQCKAHKRIPLDFMPAAHPEFPLRLTNYLRASIQKGIPSLYQDIKRLYTHPGKAEAIGAALDAIHSDAVAAGKALRTGGVVPGSGSSGAPTDVMWTLANQAAHQRRIGNGEAALALAEEALAHSPTVIELYSLKARCLKTLGRLEDAADVLDMARGLDLADRHINTKCVKYMLAAGRPGPAADTMALFARQDGDPLFNIIDMQHLWYCIHSADAYAAEGNVALALKRYHNVHAHFSTFIEDQFDFHQYVLRRANLRVYLDFMAWVDGLHREPFYVRALAGMAKQYIFLAEHPELKVDVDGVKEPTEGELAAMTPADRKKAKNAYKNAKKKAEAERVAALSGAAAGAAGGSGGGKKGKKPPKKDEDPHGYKYLATNDPLAQAAKFSQLWLASQPRCGDAGVVTAQVALRQGKGAAAAQGVAVAKAASPPPAGLAEVTEGLLAWAKSEAGSAAPSAVLSVVADVLQGKLQLRA